MMRADPFAGASTPAAWLRGIDTAARTPGRVRRATAWLAASATTAPALRRGSLFGDTLAALAGVRTDVSPAPTLARGTTMPSAPRFDPSSRPTRSAGQVPLLGGARPTTFASDARVGRARTNGIASRALLQRLAVDAGSSFASAAAPSAARASPAAARVRFACELGDRVSSIPPRARATPSLARHGAAIRARLATAYGTPIDDGGALERQFATSLGGPTALEATLARALDFDRVVTAALSGGMLPTLHSVGAPTLVDAPTVLGHNSRGTTDIAGTPRLGSAVGSTVITAPTRAPLDPPALGPMVPETLGPGDTGAPAPPAAARLAISRGPRAAAGDDDRGLFALTANIERILNEQARRHGIDV